MPRQVRIEFDGALYHVMARGDRQEAIVRDDEDRRTFLRTLGEACKRAGFRLHAYVLMTNHYHLLIETPEGNLSSGMGWLQNAFTRRINTRHRLWGHVFGGRYKSILVEPGNCFGALLDYIHLNPVRAGIVKEADGLESFSWSSLKCYLETPGRRPEWIETQTGFSVVGTKDTTAGRREFLGTLERRVDWQNPTKAGAVWSKADGQPKLAVHSALRRGWFFGSQAFKEKLLEAADGKFRERIGRKADGYHGSDVKDHGEKRAGALIQAGLQYFQTSLIDLQSAPKNDSRKVLLAEMIQSETTMRLDWICAHLKMGTRSWCCHQIREIRLALRTDKSLTRTRQEIANTIKND